MKKYFYSLVTFAFVLLFTINILPQEMTDAENQAKHKIVKKNPVAGTKCGDEDIRLDCAFKLGEMKSEIALFTLMKLLREDPSEAVRIVAAQSLIKIGDPRGIHLVARNADFNDFAKVRLFCDKFYKAYVYSEYLAKIEKPSDEDESGTGTSITSINK